jgi:hypothetical protein
MNETYDYKLLQNDKSGFDDQDNSFTTKRNVSVLKTE